ncbi:xaa-Pro dipeptidase, metalloprotease family M24B [Thraustotheca clavata]|uniref:Xaa-Pro dipeptidase n=1 Tax=Thraustotheca clavata TaxID=74557 RepID=A0A1V9YZ49_9STRA|nr:xaa-Pro dipeptidase, metalloprotease family M24B [Thraustotheca clavata]
MANCPITIAAATVAAIGGLHLLQRQYLASKKSCNHRHRITLDPRAVQHKCKSGYQYETFEIDFAMHREHREKIIARMLKLNGLVEHSCIMVHGGTQLGEYDTDTDYAFKQESMFQYLFGVKEPDCAGAIDLVTKESILFVPRLSEEWALWCGDRKPLSWFKTFYGVDHVHFTDEIATVLLARQVKNLYLLKGVNLDSGVETQTTSKFDDIDKFTTDLTALHPELVECRVTKSEKELELLRWINRLSSNAHIKVMETIEPGMVEFHAESEFLHACYSQGGARFHAYTCICGSGHNASALHYGHAGAPNDKVLNDGDVFLNDMGCEYHGYASDITCTFPVNGKFTPDQKFIYEGVLKAHDAVIAAMKPGVEWVDMHLLSQRVLTEHLLQGGLFQNGSVDELMEAEISAYFYPHGLGHLMGLDVHDVGGYLPGTGRTDTRMLRKLRAGRKLEKNMVITVEPGCYFIEGQIEELLSSPATAKYINKEVLARFRKTGGVRIESDVIVTATGAENMSYLVPRKVAEIEALMARK